MDHRDRPVAQSLARAGRPFSYLRDPPSARCWPSLALRALTGVQRPSRWAALSAAAMLPSRDHIVMEAEYRFDGSILASHRATRSSFRRFISTAMSRRFLPAPRVQADCGAQAGTCLDNPPLRRKCSLSLRKHRFRLVDGERCGEHDVANTKAMKREFVRRFKSDRPTMLNALAISIGAVGLG